MRRAAVHILKAIRFILFPDDSFTKGQLPIFVTGHWRILSYVHISLSHIPSQIDSHEELLQLINGH